MAEIRREMELAHFKWDAQVGDVATLAPFPFLLEDQAWSELALLAEKLTAETLALEAALVERRDLHALLGLPRPLRHLFAERTTPTPPLARVMRFDFHFTTEGWRVSEVNSDVPGGYTEATNFTRLIAAHVPSARPVGDPAAALVAAIGRRKLEHGTVALTCAPGHMEDQQVVAFLAASLREHGMKAEVIAPEHLRWHGGLATIDSAWFSGPASAIVRFYQVEWLAHLPPSIAWRFLFVGGRTPVANPGVAALTESKRLPLVWDRLGVDVPTWRRLLPETRPLAEAPWRGNDGWLIKSAYSNTGDTVSMREEMSSADWRRRVWSARFRPSSWLAQRRFDVVRVVHDGEPLFPCIGVYTVDGVAAGAYARAARRRVVDAFARDVAILVTRPSGLPSRQDEYP